MSAQNKKAVCGQANGLSETSSVRKPHSNTKKASVIKRFVELGDRGMTCFDAANKYHDYVLRSTVSGIQRDFGIEFRKEWTKVPNSFGTLTDCVRYWLDEGNRAKAINLFGFEEVL